MNFNARGSRRLDAYILYLSRSFNEHCVSCQLIRLWIANQLTTLGLVVADEVHMVGDSQRGFLLEVALTKVIAAGDKSMQLVGLSATAPNLHELAT